MLVTYLAFFISVYGNTWFEHIKAYYSHKDEMNILYVTYEDMIQVWLASVTHAVLIAVLPCLVPVLTV